MSRVDVPTLKCDRCKDTTQDLGAMGRFATLRRSTIGGEEEWDLCPTCWAAFRNFVGTEDE